jgi:adenosylcobinamide-GDP ribazoletransferase
MTLLSRQWHAFVTAVQFLTRIPLPGGMNRTPGDRSLLRAAVIYFPLVGAFIGAWTGLIIGLALSLWPPVLAVVLGLIAEAWLTGAFHEDAVADCADAFGGGWTSDDVMRILKDSRIGSFGALGLILAVLLRGGCLSLLPRDVMIPVAIASASLGRWVILLLMAFVPPIPNRESLAKDVGERIGAKELVLGTIMMAMGISWYAGIMPVRASVGIILACLLAVAWANYVKRRLGGMTGDCLGCGCYLGQCLVLVVATAGLTP